MRFCTPPTPPCFSFPTPRGARTFCGCLASPPGPREQVFVRGVVHRGPREQVFVRGVVHRGPREQVFVRGVVHRGPREQVFVRGVVWGGKARTLSVLDSQLREFQKTSRGSTVFVSRKPGYNCAHVPHVRMDSLFDVRMHGHCIWGREAHPDSIGCGVEAGRGVHGPG